jgi:hypothetical protein
MYTLTDEQIQGLIQERKPIPAQLQPLGAMTERSHHHRRDFKVSAPSGSQFCLFYKKGGA